MPNRNIVDFFVVGAQKAGTTTIYALMRQHVDLFLPDLKESHFFSLPSPEHHYKDAAADRMNKTAIRTQQGYAALFKDSGTRVRGEICPTYLYPDFAAERISNSIPGAKIIIMLRNPIDRTFSAYRHMKSRGAETAKSFDAALALELEHIKNGWQEMAHYTKASLYYKQVKRYYEHFPAGNIHIVKFEEFVKDPIAETNRALEFLGVSSLPETVTIRQTNKTHVVENTFLKNALANKKYGVNTLRKLVPASYRGQIKEWLLGKLATKPEQISPTTRNRLRNIFTKDIEKLEELTNISFKDWK